MCPDSLSRDRYFEGIKKGTETPTTETATLFNYPGWVELVAGLEPKTPEMALNDASTDLASKWNDLLAPHSPLSPEGAAKAGLDFESGTNIAYGALTAIVTAIEAAGFGQLETPAMMLPNAPVVRASTEAAVALRMAYLDASLIKGVGYYAAAVHQPTIIDERTLIDAFNMGFIDEATFKGQMMYHGYTPERSTIIGATGIRMPDIGTILELRRRGILTDKGAADWMVLNKIPRATAEAITQLYEQRPEPYRFADFAAKGLISDQVLSHVFDWFGIKKDWADVWKESQQTYPNVGTAFELYWRNIIDRDTLKTYLVRQGFKGEVADKTISLTENIPPSGDLVTMVVREAFDPKYVTPAPEIFAKYMAMRGFTKDWSDRYWTMHWVRIPLAQAYDNYYRGYWTKEQLLEELKVSDFHPGIREDIINVAYGVPSIRELGYGYDVGVYTLEDIKRYRRWGGLSPEDAEKAATSLVAYRTEAERNAVRTEYMYSYGRGGITREQLEGYLLDIGTAPEAIPLWLERADLYKDRVTKEPAMPEQRIPSSSEAITAFKLVLRDETWLRNALKELLWTDERINLAVEKAKHDIAEEQKPPPEPTPRMLTASQMRQLYLKGLIDTDFMLAVFVEQGYKMEDAMLLVEIYTQVEEVVVEPRLMTKGDVEELYAYGVYNAADVYDHYKALNYSEEDSIDLSFGTVVSVLLPYVRSWYSKGWITSDDVYNELLATGLSEDKASELTMTIVKYEGPNRTVPEKDLTKAEIIKGVKMEVLTFAQGVELLMDLGYSEDEANYLLLINKVVAAGDPDSYLQMKQITQAYKKARGEKVMEIPNEALKIEMEMKAVKAELDKERKLGVNEAKIAELALKLNELEGRMRTVIAKASTGTPK